MGIGVQVGRCGERYEGRCRKVCWGVGEVRRDVGKGEGSEERWEMWGSVLGPHSFSFVSKVFWRRIKVLYHRNSYFEQKLFQTLNYTL